VVILELIHAAEPSTFLEEGAFISPRPDGFVPIVVVTLDNYGGSHSPRTGDASFKCLPYQLSMVGYAPTMVVTGNGESGFDSGEGA
jgi:hypothetical protein